MSEGAAPAPTSEPFKLTPRLLIVSASVIVAVFMAALDATVANVALPHMQGSMNASLDQIAWVLTSYVVASAICTPLTGFIATRFGRRRLFVLSVIGFTLASFLCGSAQNLEQIVLFRLMQGACGAFLMPLSQSILMDSYPKEKQPAIISVWLMVGMLAPILGPSIGGALIEFLNWRWVFYVNIPIGILATLGGVFFLSDSKHDPNTSLDHLGFVFFTVAIASFQLMMDRGTTLDWFSSREIVIEASVAAITFYIFIVHAMTTPHPYINTSLFKNFNFCFGMGLSFLIFLVTFSSTALLPTMLQSLLGYPVIAASMLVMPRGLGMLLTTVLAGRMRRDLDPRGPIVIGVCIIAFGQWQLSDLNLNAPESLIMVSGLLQGAGLGLALTPLLNVGFATLEQKSRTDGTSMYAMARNLSISIGVSATSTLLSRSIRINHAELVEHITPYSRSLQFLAPQALSTVQSLQGVAAMDMEVDRQAMMMAYVGVFRLQAFVLIGAALFIILLRPSRNASPVEAVVPE